MAKPNVRFGMEENTPVDFKPTWFVPGVFGGNQTDRMYGKMVEGPNSYNGGVTNVRPFWISPYNLLPHNVYMATQIPVADKGTLQANVLGMGALMAGSFGLGGLRGVTYLVVFWIVAWLAWIADMPGGLRALLTSPELLINV